MGRWRPIACGLHAGLAAGFSGVWRIGPMTTAWRWARWSWVCRTARPQEASAGLFGTRSSILRDIPNHEARAHDPSSSDVVLGPHQFMSRLAPSPLGERWLTLHTERQSSHIVHLFDVCHDNADRRRFLSAAEPLAKIDNAHVLRVESYGFARDGRPWLVTPYPGTHDGVLTLEALASRKPNNRMEPMEVERAAVHLLEALAVCHASGLHNGPLDGEQVLVDPRGAVVVEHYGFARALSGLGRGDAELVRDEVRAVAEIAYRLLTGVPAEAPVIPASRLVRRCPVAWSRWLDTALDPASGFDSAEAAIAALPSMARESGEPAAPGVGVRKVWTRVRSLHRDR